MATGPSGSGAVLDNPADLARRGLRGVKLVISDAQRGPEGGRGEGSEGELAALPRRLLQMHWPTRTRASGRWYCADQHDLRSGDGPTPHTGNGAWHDHQLRENPKLAVMMDGAEHGADMDFPKEHRVKIHSTNVPERLNGEIGASRRGRHLSNEAAIRRLARRCCSSRATRYAIQKRYMSLESLAAR